MLLLIAVFIVSLLYSVSVIYHWRWRHVILRDLVRETRVMRARHFGGDGSELLPGTPQTNGKEPAPDEGG